MNYRSVSDLNDDVLAWSGQLPPDLDLIVGIPRSGLLAAGLLALHLNRPLADIDGLLQGRTLGAGPRLRPDGRSGAEPMTVLVVDDSVWSGGQMSAVRHRIEAARLPHRVLYGAVYVLPGATGLVDFYYQTLGLPRAFEWNIMHHPYLRDSCLVGDGILWPGGRAFSQGRSTADAETGAAISARFRPSQPIGHLIVEQPASSSAAVEAWLAQHHIECNRVTLIGPPGGSQADAAARRAAKKAALYRHTRAWIFIEAQLEQAVLIARLASRPAFSFQGRQMIYPGVAPARRAVPLLRHRLHWQMRLLAITLEDKLRQLAQARPVRRRFQYFPQEADDNGRQASDSDFSHRAPG